MSDTKQCPFCAEDVKAAAIKCKHCGEALGEAPAQESALFCLGDISVTSSVIKTGKEALPVANISSVKILKMLDPSDSATPGCGGCLAFVGGSVVLGGMSLMGEGPTGFIFLIAGGCLVVGGLHLSTRPPTTLDLWKVVVNDSKTLADRMSHENALGMEASIVKALSMVSPSG